jgi:hypothetical protein
MKKFAPWVIAVLLLLYGLPTLTKSVLGGLFFIIAGLALLPTTKNLLIQKVPQAALLDKPIVNYIAVAIFAVLGVMATGASEKAALIEKYTANKEAITKEITDLDAAKDFIMAEIKLKPYLNAMPTDSELRALSEKIKADAKQDKEEKAAKKAKEDADKKAAAQREAAEAAERQKNAAAENARQAANGKIIALSYQCNANYDVEQAVLTARMNQEAGQINVALNIIKATQGCSVGAQGPKLSKGEWELIANGNYFVALRAKTPQKYGSQYVYGITTKNAYENPN